MTIYVIANQKGGVGKTTTSINLAASFAAMKRRVLLLDLDPQGNASVGSGVQKGQYQYAAVNVLCGEVSIKEARVKTASGFDLLATNNELIVAEMKLLQAENRENRLKNILQPVINEYDYIVIDCPPSLSILTVNALVAAHSVLIPIQCEYFALEGLGKLLNTIKIVQSRLNKELEIEGILLTMYDQRLNLSNQVVSEVKRRFEQSVFNTIIHRNTRLGEAQSLRQPIIMYDADSKGAVNYLNLAREIMQNNGMTNIPMEDKFIEEPIDEKLN